jgi:hypothetical protein
MPFRSVEDLLEVSLLPLLHRMAKNKAIMVLDPAFKTVYGSLGNSVRQLPHFPHLPDYFRPPPPARR